MNANQETWAGVYEGEVERFEVYWMEQGALDGGDERGAGCTEEGWYWSTLRPEPTREGEWYDATLSGPYVASGGAFLAASGQHCMSHYRKLDVEGVAR